MIWAIQTSKGTFEGEGLKKRGTGAIYALVDYYGYNHDQDLPQIEAIFSESGKELCKNGIRKIEDYIEEEVKQWRKEAKENSEEMELVRQDYINNLI